MVTAVWYLKPLRKCDSIGNMSANGTRIEIRKLVNVFAPRCPWTYGNIATHSTNVMKWHWGSRTLKMSNLKWSKLKIKIDSVCRLLLLQRKPKLGRTMPSTGPQVGHSWSKPDVTTALGRTRVQPQAKCSDYEETWPAVIFPHNTLSIAN